MTDSEMREAFTMLHKQISALGFSVAKEKENNTSFSSAKPQESFGGLGKIIFLIVFFFFFFAKR